MSGEETIGTVYGNALLELAFEKGVHGEVLAELREFDALLAKEADFEAFLGTPSERGAWRTQGGGRRCSRGESEDVASPTPNCRTLSWTAAKYS